MSRQPQFKETGKRSLFGYFYLPILERDPNHFLIALDNLFDWDSYSEKLLVLYKGKGIEGRPPYDPALILKMLFISYLYNISEREVERLADQHMLVKWFLGLAVNEAPPDHSTLTAFKERTLNELGSEILKDIFDGMLKEAIEHGVQLGTIQVLDSVHTQANVNNIKDRERQEKGQESRDPDAKVVNKGKRSVVTAEGESVEKEIRYRGFKTHTSTNAETLIVTSIIPAPGDTADNKAFVALRRHDRELGLPVTTYAGDRAYDDTDIYTRLAEEGLSSGITLHDYRTKKKDDNKEPWLTMKASETYKKANGVRYRVEIPYGWAKAWHGFERCRYLGLARYAIQSTLTFMVSNVKRFVKLLTGITFRAQAKGRRAEVFKPVYTIMPWA
ncbi:MAG: transposase [Planctomycetes bacterium]|nr:transposase [Planctomycetota bacterium]